MLLLAPPKRVLLAWGKRWVTGVPGNRVCVQVTRTLDDRCAQEVVVQRKDA